MTQALIPCGFFVSWYEQHGRSFPWRDQSINAFGILIAEALLRQTRAEMVARVWPVVLSAYPDAEALANAVREDLYHLIRGLGFVRQRTQALIELGRALVELGGVVPSRAEELLELPHVGLYIAHAVECFSFGFRVPVVDSNVARVVTRLTGWPAVSDIRRAKEVWKACWEILPAKQVREHNYGLLDFGALLCKARGPHCGTCRLAGTCAYYQAACGRPRQMCSSHVTEEQPVERLLTGGQVV